ncbi:unnamed protein product [Ectocarpus sp. 4 AP-2014]|uniref:Peroxisomal membrane protein-related n=1 Tax=Ectocarpus siliculosus TaxID=2880 RepID=D8LGB2_ECTSI|nr:peroxisomal membrane protein-related [Ectocarpus siliculosus]|eukprot:CBN79011.1 peroxisomal membrane protein-related [Ectocarpus siliculosus]
MSGIWAAYNKALAAQPLLVKAMTSFTGFTVGDILAQKFISPEDDYDFMRTLRLGTFGALVHGPTGHYFYGMLDAKLPGTKPMTVASKVAIDQTIWNPIFGVMFFTYLGLAEGKSVDDIQKKIKNDLATAVMGSWTVWIPAHTINFKFVPTSQRLLYINTIQIGYNIFLSFLGNKKADDDSVKSALVPADAGNIERFAEDAKED